MAFPTLAFFWEGGSEVVKRRNALTMSFIDIRREMWIVQIEWEMCNIKKNADRSLLMPLTKVGLCHTLG